MLLSYKKLVIGLAVLLAAMPTAAQSRSIYGAGVDEDSVLVRLVNAGATNPTEVRIGALKLSVPALGATPYRPTLADIFIISYAGKRYEFIPEAGSYYTLIESGDKLVILNDVKHTNRARAQIYFYNMTGGTPAELKTSDGKTSLVGPCAAGSSAQIAVNPVSLTLAVYQDGEKSSTDMPVKLERGASFSVFAYSGPAGAAAFVVKAAVAK